MSSSEALQVATRYKDICNAMKVEEPSTLDLIDEDAVWVDPRFPPCEGKERIGEYLEQLGGENRSFQIKWEFTNVISKGDHVAAEWTVESGIEIDGKRLFIEGASVFKIRDGKIYYYRGYWDTAIITRLLQGD